MAAIARLRAFVQPLKAVSNRAFGSAAAVQCYYDDDDEEEEFAQCVVPNTMLDAQGSAPERGVQWVMIGEPVAKRHLFAERLSKLLEVPHISMGTLLRQELNPRSSLYQQIANALDQGKLVPEEIIFGLLSKRLEDGYSRGETGFILDGIPRTRIQAEILDHIARVDLVVNFKCSEENLVKKNLGTRKLSPCQEYIFMRCSMTPTNQLQDERVHNQAEEVTTYILIKSLIWFMIKISEDKEGLESPLKVLHHSKCGIFWSLNMQIGGTSVSYFACLETNESHILNEEEPQVEFQVLRD